MDLVHIEFVSADDTGNTVAACENWAARGYLHFFAIDPMHLEPGNLSKWDLSMPQTAEKTITFALVLAVPRSDFGPGHELLTVKGLARFHMIHGCNNTGLYVYTK